MRREEGERRKRIALDRKKEAKQRKKGAALQKKNK